MTADDSTEGVKTYDEQQAPDTEPWGPPRVGGAIEKVQLLM